MSHSPTPLNSVIFFARVNKSFLGYWEYYGNDIDMLKSTYSRVIVVNTYLGAILSILKTPNAHIYCWWWNTSFPVLFLSWLLQRKSICTGAIHMFDCSGSPDFYSSSFLIKLLIPISLRIASINLFISLNQFQSITSHLKVNNPRLLYSSLSLHSNCRKLNINLYCENLPLSRINLLFVGWLSINGIKRKSLPCILKALAICIHDLSMDIHLTIAGKSGNGNLAIDELIHELCLHEYVDIINNLSQAEKDQLYIKSDLFVSPSFMEGFGNATLEAMSFGCPAVVSCYGASPEVVGNTGYILNTITPSSLVNILCTYSGLIREERNCMRTSAYNRAYAMFGFSRRLDEFKDIMTMF